MGKEAAGGGSKRGERRDHGQGAAECGRGREMKLDTGLRIEVIGPG